MHRGIVQITANGTPLLTGCGFYFIGSATGSDDQNNITTCNSNNGGLMRPTGSLSPSLTEQMFFQVDPTNPAKLNFGGEYGPSTQFFSSVSMPMDARRDLFTFFRYQGSPLRRYDDNPYSYSISLGPVSIFNAGNNQSWAEIISDEYTIRVTLTGASKIMPLYFVNHPSTRNIEYSFNSVQLNEHNNVTASFEVYETDPAILPYLTFQTEVSQFHQIGRLDGDGWSVNVTDTPNMYLNYGPYTTAVTAGSHTAAFRLQADNVTADNLPLVRLEVNDATTGTVIASQLLTRQMFSMPYTYKTFNVPFTAAAGHQLEFRTFWLGNSYVKQDRVIVK